MNDHVNDFGLFRLHKTLVDLGCDSTTQTRLISWFWRNAPLWNADDQSEFDAKAKENLTVEYLRPAIRGGLRVSIPANLRSRQIVETDTGKQQIAETQISDDAEQNAWVRLLEGGDTDSKSAYFAGMSAGRDATRDSTKYLPVSQMESPADDTGIYIQPWESSADTVSHDFDRQVWRLIREVEDDNRKKVLLDYWDKSPEDIEFLFSYLARSRHRRRGRPASQRERDRAANIIKKLRRMERNIVF